MRDCEAWAVIGETIKQAGPTTAFPGLCVVLDTCRTDGLICSTQYDRMVRQLRWRYGHLMSKTGTSYYWRTFQIPPRVRACKTMAKLTSELAT